MTNLVPFAQLSSKRYEIKKGVSTDAEIKETLTEAEKVGMEIIESAKRRGALILQSAMKKAEQTVREAEKKKGQILEEAEKSRAGIGKMAREEGKKIREDAKKEGYSQGFIQGQADGEEKSLTYTKEVLNELKELIVKSIEEYKASVKELEPEIVELALNISEKIIRHEVSSYSKMAFEQAGAALARLNDRSKVTIRANKLDLEQLNNYRDQLIALQDDIKELIIVEDLRVEEGGCIVESPSGAVDGRLSNQLDAVKKGFSDLLECDIKDDQTG